MSSDTTSSKTSRLEVIQTGARRRWTDEEKLRIVAESYVYPRGVSATAQRHGLSSGQLFDWRKRAREAAAGAAPACFAPALIVPDPAPTRAQGRAVAAGLMEIVLGPVRIVVGADVDEAALARVLAAVARR